MRVKGRCEFGSARIKAASGTRAPHSGRRARGAAKPRPAGTSLSLYLSGKVAIPKGLERICATPFMRVLSA